MQNKAITSIFNFLLIILSGRSHTPGGAAVSAGPLEVKGAELGQTDRAKKGIGIPCSLLATAAEFER